MKNQNHDYWVQHLKALAEYLDKQQNFADANVCKAAVDLLESYVKEDDRRQVLVSDFVTKYNINK